MAARTFLALTKTATTVFICSSLLFSFLSCSVVLADPEVDASSEAVLSAQGFRGRWHFVTRLLSFYETPTTPAPSIEETTVETLRFTGQRDVVDVTSTTGNGQFTDPFVSPVVQSQLRRSFDLGPNGDLSLDPPVNAGPPLEDTTAATDTPSTMTPAFVLQRALALQGTSETMTNSELQANFANAAKYQDKDYPYETSNLTAPPFCSRSTHGPDGLLTYPGAVQDNILNMTLLYRALSCLDVHMLKDATIQELFEYVRDRQYFANSSGNYNEDEKEWKVTIEQTNNANRVFKRRVPWLNPLDGCMSRAEFVATWTYEYMKLPHDAMYKVYLFGNTLQVPTKYTSTGFIRNWVYHMAPMMFSEERGFVVLDPSLNHYRPMKLEEWILFMCPGATKLSNANNLRGFAISNRFAFWPTSACDATESRYSLKRLFDDGYSFVTQDLKWMESLLQDEYKIITELGLDPMRYLGDVPPWKEAMAAHHDMRLFI